MRLSHIYAKNFKGFSEVNLDLGKNTVFFGINGVGKSSLLALINYSIRPLCYRLNPSQGMAFSTLSDECVQLGQSDMKIEISINVENNTYILTRNHKKSMPGKRASSTIILNPYSLLADKIRSMVETGNNLPIFVNYGTNRSVLQIPLRIRQKHDFNQYASLERAVENYIDFKTFFEWFRNQEDIENEYIRDHGDNKYRDKSLECVRRAVESMLDQVTGLRIRRNPIRMIVEKNGQEIMVDYLSDGEKCTLALFGDLARRLAIANPNLDNPLGGDGIVLIDEIELHMHPTWQRKILTALNNVFPNIQFIITTHSPQVLGELNAEYTIFHIKRAVDSEQTITSIERMDGFDSNYILENFMDTPSVNTAFSEKIRKTYSLINNNEFEKAKEAIDEIIQLTEQNHTEVIRLEGALKRGEYLYEKHNKG